MRLPLTKQKDDSSLFSFHFCKQRKERKEIPGGRQADTGEGFTPRKSYSLALIHRRRGLITHQVSRGTQGVTENWGSRPLVSSHLGRRNPVLGHRCFRTLCAGGVRVGLWTR